MRGGVLAAAAQFKQLHRTQAGWPRRTTQGYRTRIAKATAAPVTKSSYARVTHLFRREVCVVYQRDVGGLCEVRVVEHRGIALVDRFRQIHVAVEQHERQVLVTEIFAQRAGLLKKSISSVVNDFVSKCRKAEVFQPR